MAARFFTRQSQKTYKEASTAAQVTGPTLKHKFEGHKEAIWSFVFLHDNIHIVSCSVDGTMRKWNCDTGLIVGDPWEGEGGSIYPLVLSPDGKVIACGRNDASVQRWNTDGEMMEGVWKDQSCKRVQALSWSPDGDRLASGFHDGIIVIQNSKNGEVEVNPIVTEQDKLYAVAYSPSGDRIASGGSLSGDRFDADGNSIDNTICIWNAKTGELVVGPIKDLGNTVTSVIWSSDSSKLYSASDFFARVFDGTTGELLHRYEHDHSLFSIVLSPKNNVLACVGYEGVAQLWNTESHKPLGLPFRQNHESLHCVSFSSDGKYLAYGGSDRKITLWVVNDIVPGLAVSILPQQGHGQLDATQPDKSRPQSPSCSCLDVDATGGDGIIDDGNPDPYNNFFQSSQSSIPASTSGPPQPPNLSSARRLWNTISQHRLSSIPLRKRKFSARRARSNSFLEPETLQLNQPTPDRAGKDEGENDADCGPANHAPDAKKDTNNQPDEPLTIAQNSLSDDPTPPAKLDSEGIPNLWKRLMRAPGKDPIPVQIAPVMKRPNVVEVYAVRGYQRYVASTPKRKTKSQTVAYSAPLVAPHTSDSSPAGPLPQAGSVQPGTSSQLSPQAGPPSYGMVGNGAQHSQAAERPSSHASPSHFVANYHTNHDSDSRSSIEGSCNRFLDKLCFPRGHFY